MRDRPFDKSSKWLIEHQARGILRLGGLQGVRRYRAGPGQIVQPSKLPDGLLEAQLKFPDPELWILLGDKAVMLEFPLIQELRAEAVHDVILEVLKGRFGPVPRDVIKLLRAVLNEKKLKKLGGLAGTCPDLAAFREALLT